MSPSRIHAAAAAAVTACLLAAPSAALAAASKKADPYGENTPLDLSHSTADAGSATSGGGGSLVRTFVGMAIVIAVIYGLYWILRQVKSSREQKSVGQGLETAATVALGPNRSLHLVRAGNELVLVGVADHAVTPIRTYTEEEARAAGLLADDEPGDGPRPRDPDDPPGTLLAPAKRKSLRKMTIGDALDRLRQATVRT